MEVNQSWIVPIEKLMYWRLNSWVKYENKLSSIFLRLHCDQILLTNGDKVLESLNMNGKIKGIYKGDVLILITCTKAQEIRKLKFQIKSNAEQHLQKLGKYFPVVNHKSTANNNFMRYQNIEDVFKNVLVENYKDNSGISNLPPNYKDFVKLCLLDPAFPQVVNETHKIIESQIIKKN